MAIGRITGQMLSANLARSGTDLTFETNLLALDVTNSRVGVGTASPATTLHVNATDAIRLPSGSSAQRPGTPANGDIRYNSDTGAVEGYAGGWLKMTGGTSLADADSDTQIEVERTADEDAMHFQVAGTDAAHIRADGNIELNNLQIADTTISTLSTNGNLNLTPNGTGEVNISKVDIDSGAIDGTTIGANSAAAGTFTTIETSGNATIGGNLTVNGTTTTVATTNTTVSDNLLELNSGAASNANDSGIIIERGSTGDNAIFVWDESADKFVVGTTTATADSTGDLTISTATLVANLEATTATVGGSNVTTTDNTQTLTNKTFDANGTGNSISNIDFADFTSGVILDEDNMASDSATNLATQQSIKAYVDAEDANIASDTLTFTNKTFDANGTGNSISNIETADLAAGVLDTDLASVSASDDTLASAKAIKAYVDGEVSGFSSNSITQGNTSATVTDTGSDGAFTVVADGNTELTINDTQASFSGNVTVSGNLTVNGTTTTVATTNTTIEDNILELNSGVSSSGNDSGILIERGTTGDNAFIGWDESADKFTVGTTTATADDKSGGITVTKGTLVADLEGDVTGDVTGTVSDISNHLLDEDNMASDSATKAPSQQSVKAYVDAQDANIASDTLTFTNKTFDANGTGNSLSNVEVADLAASAVVLESEGIGSNDNDTTLPTSAAVKDFVDTETANVASDTMTFTNKTFDANGTGNSISNIEVADFASGEVLDEDNMASDSATNLATQQSIKAYVDNEIGNVSTNSITQGNTSATVTDTGSDGAFTVVADGNTELVINDTSATFSGNVIITGDMTVSGTTTTIDSTTLTVEDPLIQLAKNNSGGDANTFDQGLFFNRGSLDNVSFIWDESADQFAFAVTSGEDGNTAGNITIDSYAALKAGVITGSDVETGVISAADGTQSATIADSTGVMTIASSVLTTADINGGTADAVTIGGSTAAAGTFTTATATNVQATNIKANDGTAAIVITDSTGAVELSTATTVSGTLTATGNVGVDGGTFTFNETGADLDFRFEGDNNANLLFGDAGNDRIGIKTATPGYDLDIGSSTDAVLLPQGTTAQRPTATTGIIRFNTQTGQYEGCQDGSTYVNFAIAGDAPTFTKETTTGDGSTTTFSGFFSTAPESANNVFVYIDNVYQEPTENYTVSGTDITFTSAPHSGARIFAITGADNTALATGGVARSETSATSVSGSTATNIMTFNAATYRSAELFITVQDSGNTQYSAMKATVLHDGTTAYGSTYAVTNTAAGDIVDISFNHDGSNTVEVKATPLNSGTQSIKVQYSLSAI